MYLGHRGGREEKKNVLLKNTEATCNDLIFLP